MIIFSVGFLCQSHRLPFLIELWSWDIVRHVMVLVAWFVTLQWLVLVTLSVLLVLELLLLLIIVGHLSLAWFVILICEGAFRTIFIFTIVIKLRRVRILIVLFVTTVAIRSLLIDLLLIP